MHARIINGAVETYPYSIGRLRKDNPNTSFPRTPSDALLAVYDVFPVQRVERPEHHPLKQDLHERTPEYVDGAWRQVWELVDVSPEELARRVEEQHEQLRQQRAAAYREEADPIFFQAQRGAAELSDWEAKVQEIRERFQYPTVE